MKILRMLAPTALALIGLTPLPATAFANVLDVAPETADLVTSSGDCLENNDDCIYVLTATVTDGGAPPAAEVDISFEIESGPSDPDPGPDPLFATQDATCTTVAGVCKASLHSSTEGIDEVRAWIEDGNPLPIEVDTGETLGPDDADMTDVVEVGWYDGELNVEPEEGSFAPGADVTFEATVLEKGASAGAAKTLLANVDLEIEGATAPNNNQNPASVDAECSTLQATGKCSLTYTASSTAGVDEPIRTWIDQNENQNVSPATGDETTGADFEADKDEKLDASTDDGKGAVDETDITDVVKANISGGQVLVLSGAGTKTVNTASGLTAKLTSAGTPQSGINIAAAVDAGGANAGKTAVCLTAANGECTLTYTGTNAGIDKVRATVDADKNGLPNEADSTENVGVAGGTPEPDTTAVAQITWTAPTPPPGAGGVKNQCDATRPSAGKNEIVVGTKGNDKLCGFGGNDTLRGLAGNDRLNGGKGKDTAKGGKGKDRCRAEVEKRSCEK